MDTARLKRATKLKAIINVETNFSDNIDHEYCFANGIHVLTPGSAFADAVAESALGMAIDLARGITRADRGMRQGVEAYGLEGKAESHSLFGAAIGLIGFGDLSRSFLKLVAPFNCHIKVFEPWVPDYAIRRRELCTRWFGLSDLSLVINSPATQFPKIVGRRRPCSLAHSMAVS